MPFITVSDEVIKKSITCVENKFISKYLPLLEPDAVKVYLYTLYISQSGLNHYTVSDLATSLNMPEEKVRLYFEYLDELELISITSLSPFEIKILDADNIYGLPKKYKPEKYSDFTKSAQSILKGRMISTNEFMEYFYLLEEYGFEQDALLMIISYCVNLRGDNIRYQYIKKVAKSFADDGITSAKKVDEKLSSYTSTTPLLLKLFSACGIKKQPDVEDDKLYKKWSGELGFGDDAIISAAKSFKIKNCEKLDAVLTELYKNRKFDVKEIDGYAKNKTSLYSLTRDIAKNLGVYISDAAPYVENYVNSWCNYGFSADILRALSAYLFRQSKSTFNDMDLFLQKLYEQGIVTDESVNEYIKNQENDEKLLRRLLDACGLTRRIIDWDKTALKNWRLWNFSEEMMFEAAALSVGKANPTAYMNAVLSSWKNNGITSPDKIPTATTLPSSAKTDDLKAKIENHYARLRHIAESKADSAVKTVNSDPVYSKLHKQINELSIQLAFAELRDSTQAQSLSEQLKTLEQSEKERLSELCLTRDDLSPRYSCPVCNDTGYDKNGNVCRCLKKFISENK